MGYNELEIELKKVMVQVERWRESGYMPTIEQGIALSRLQKVYTLLMDLPSTDPSEIPGDEITSESDAPKAEAKPIEPVEWDKNKDEEVVEDGFDGETGGKAEDVSDAEGEVVYVSPDDESFDEENGKNEQHEKADDDGDFADSPAEEDAPKSGIEILGTPVSTYAKEEIVNNLFHGNVELFEREMEKFDAMGSLEEALVYIGETYHWVPEHAATIKFIDLLENRFK